MEAELEMGNGEEQPDMSESCTDTWAHDDSCTDISDNLKISTHVHDDLKNVEWIISWAYGGKIVDNVIYWSM